MATIGQPLTAPETGWRRVQDTEGIFKYSKNPAWDESTHYFAPNISIEFIFTGTKFRWIGASGNGACDNATVFIDGIQTGTFRQDGSSTYTLSILQYEITSLASGPHTVKIVNNATNGGSLILDAIDIESTVRPIHPDEVMNVSDLKVGKRIRCHYQATYNAVGIFSGLGQETSAFIPPGASLNPNGDFYYIAVDDYNSQIKMIADRDIQMGISWDVLNSSGIASGSGLPLQFSNVSTKGAFTTRLLVDDSAANPSVNNEWYDYIVKSTLNDTVPAASDYVWNFSNSNRHSWTSTTINGTAANRLLRGRQVNGIAQSTTDLTIGGSVYSCFRPVLIYEYVNDIRSFIKYDGAYKKWVEGSPASWKTISTALPSVETFQKDGMEDLSILNRKSTNFIYPMSDNGTLGNGKLFKKSVDLKKLFEITNIKVE